MRRSPLLRSSLWRTMCPALPTFNSRALNRQFVMALLEVLPVDSWPIRRAQAGQRLISAYDQPAALPLVDEGALQAVIWLDDGGHRIVPVSYESGELALCSQLFAATPVSVDLLCATESRLRWLPVAAIEDAVRRHPNTLLLLAQFMSQRMREIQYRERVWLERGVRERVWAGLLQAAGQLGQAGVHGVRLTLTHEQLAERCGVSRPKASQELKQLEKAGLVKLGRGHIDVRDIAAPLPTTRPFSPPGAESAPDSAPSRAEHSAAVPPKPPDPALP